MRSTLFRTFATLVLGGLVAGGAATAAEPNQSTVPRAGDLKKDTQTACMDMMQGQGMTDEGKKAMREFMQSPKAPQAMNNMMEMAKGMGNGDAMLGMTKMMEMMGGRGEMSGRSMTDEQSGTTQPGARTPEK